MLNELIDIETKSKWNLNAKCAGALSAMDENKSTKTGSAWGGKVANLSEEKEWEPVPQWAFIGFNLHRNTGKPHHSLLGSKDQTIDNT